MKSLAAVSILLAVFAAAEVRGGVVICQYASWAVYRINDGKFGPGDVDPYLCTHGVYVTAGLDSSDRVVSLDPWADLESGGGMGGYRKFTNLKQTNPNFKAILALGGWSNANFQFAAVAASPTRRAAMASSAVSFLKQYGFDGLEVDWLYPATVNEKNNFALLLAELRNAFDVEGFELMATVAALEETVNSAYDLEAMAESLDYMMMIGYDYEGSWNPWTGLSSPLFLDNSTLCANATVNVYLSKGVPPGKLVLGFPGFGRSYTLAYENDHTIGAPSLGPGDSGPYTLTPGVMSYNEIVEVISGWTVERDELSQSPFAYKGNQWLSLDDEVSAKFKAEYVLSKKLAGAAIWTVDEDRFVDQAFPLLRAINDGLGNPQKK